jgi:uncharacterized RDD family membrane protein YckC
VEIEDRITVVAAEGVELHIVLAGAASRFIAGMIDSILQGLLIGVSAIVFAFAIGGGLGRALFALAAFTWLYLYFVLFEVLAGGRTPGKRMTHLRVLRSDGAPVHLTASAIRNALRLVDGLPAAYLVGIGAILISRHNQRLGDIAAGTIVVREPQTTGSPQASSAGRVDGAAWDLSAITAEELAAARHFLTRRDSLEPGARRALAQRLADGFRAKVAGVPGELEPEQFLEALVRAKS